MKKVIVSIASMAVCVCLLFSLGLSAKALEKGPNSKTFVLDEQHPFRTGVIDNLKGQGTDSYEFSIPTSGQVSVVIECIQSAGFNFDRDAGTYIVLKDMYNNELPTNTGATVTSLWTNDIKSLKYSLNKGTYHFEVYKLADMFDLKYKMRNISFKSSNETFEEEFDGYNNDIMEYASSIEPGQNVIGMLAAGDKYDYYKLTLPESVRMKFVVNTSDLSNLHWTINLENGSELLSDGGYVNSGDLRLNKSYDLLAGTYYVCFWADNNKHGIYNFSNTLTSSNETEGVNESLTHTNDTIDEADEIILGTDYKGQMAVNESDDYYKFAVTTKGTPHLYVKSNTDSLGYSIYNSSGSEIWDSSSNMSSNVNVFDGDTDELDPGTYYLKVWKRKGATGDYTFKLTLISVKTETDAPVTESEGNDNKETGNNIAIDTIFTDSEGSVYKVTGNDTAMFVKPKDTNMNSVTVPDTVSFNSNNFKVTAIADKAFFKNKKLTNLTVGKNVVSIGDRAFSGAVKLKKLDLSETAVETIGANAISKCKGLTVLKINGNKVNTIKKGALKIGNKKCVITILAKNKAAYKKALKKVTKAGASKRSCKFKKSSK
ncbi:leucine-rich repeat protein [Butyrivibrio sp. JL13D10]|uniref:leucine-rich repeat protein n=1 Tax=Butyrivibrio sp. JL13D10 TaxID=3236815 RepID=UPI0038B55DBF